MTCLTAPNAMSCFDLEWFGLERPCQLTLWLPLMNGWSRTLSISFWSLAQARRYGLLLAIRILRAVSVRELQSSIWMQMTSAGPTWKTETGFFEVTQQPLYLRS